MTLNYQLRCLVDTPCMLGESPVWHAAEQTLYWVDALKPALHALDPVTCNHKHWPMPALIGSIAPRAQGGLIAAIGCGIGFIDFPEGKVHIKTLINPPLVDKHLNDGKCDRQGRFWVGEACHNKDQPNGNLYRFDPDHSLHVLERNISIFNGPCWSPDSSYFYFNDYYNERSVFRYAFHSDSGSIKNVERIIQISKNDDGIPDGCTIDSEGYLWIAKVGGQRITRYTPDGLVDTEIPLPIKRPTSCIFGGPDLDTLFITSMSQDVGEKSPSKEGGAGKLFAIQFSEIRGIPEVPFAG